MAAPLITARSLLTVPTKSWKKWLDFFGKKNRFGEKIAIATGGVCAS